MSKNSYVGANVDIATDTFGGLIDKLNGIISDMSASVVTSANSATPNTTNGGQTSGNVAITGTITTGALVVTGDIRGGNTTVSNTLILSSNTMFTGSNVDVSSNTTMFTISSANTRFSGNVNIETTDTKSFTISTGNTRFMSGQVYFNSNTYVNTVITEINSNTVIKGANLTITTTNVTLGATNTTIITINGTPTVTSIATFNKGIVTANTSNSTVFFGNYLQTASMTFANSAVSNTVLTNLGVTAVGKSLLFANTVADQLTALGIKDSVIPVGTVIYLATTTVPAGFLKLNGAEISRTAYAALFAQIGTVGGVGDGSTTFELPDARGVVIRGYDDGRGLDTGRTFGSYQDDAVLNHTHSGTTSSNGAHSHGVTDPGHSHEPYPGGSTNFVVIGAGGPISGLQSGGSWGGLGVNIYELTKSTTTGISINSAGAHTHTMTTGNPLSGGAAENRVKNIALMACIKY